MEREEMDPELGSELRRGAGREWAEEAGEDERLTELMRRRKTNLRDVIRDLAAQGGRASVEFGGHSFSGAIAHVGDDYASLSGPGQAADVRLGSATWSALPAGAPTENAPGGPESFPALLHQYSAAEETVRLALPQGAINIGKIAVVAADHVELHDVDGRLFYIPAGVILAVIRSTDRR